MMCVSRFAVLAASVAGSTLAFAAEKATKAAEPASSGSDAFSTLIIMGVLGGLGYVFYSAGLLPGGPKSDH